MATESKLFKDMFFSTSFMNEFERALEALLPGFNRQSFRKNMFSPEWEGMELKQRISHLREVLNRVFPSDFPKAASLIVRLVCELKSVSGKERSFGYICLAEYIQQYGLDHFEPSIAAMEEVTQFITCEFAARPFILKYGNRMMVQLTKWATHPQPTVRRLASEACRPRLPWAMALPEFKRDPAAVLRVLELLKSDEDIWVKKSVANNLNDISKDHPSLVLSLVRKWQGSNPHTNWIIKHASRTLLKQGNPEALAVFGFKKEKDIRVKAFKVRTPEVKLGGDLLFGCQLTNKSRHRKMVRLEYGIYYLTARGQLSRKVFKISEREYLPGETFEISRRQSFRLITTRKFYEGRHKVSLIVNGHEVADAGFTLV